MTRARRSRADWAREVGRYVTDQRHRDACGVRPLNTSQVASRTRSPITQTTTTTRKPNCTVRDTAVDTVLARRAVTSCNHASSWCWTR